MSYKASINFDSSALKRIIQKKQALIKHNIYEVVRNEAIPHLIDRIMEGYDRLSDRMNSMPEDPTNPAHWRQEFKNKLFEDLERNLIVTDKGLIVRLGDKEFLGYRDNGEGDPETQEPLSWLVYYIEGLMGEWAFIDQDLYNRKKDRSGTSNLGRFGDGFMISREQFEDEGWDSFVAFDTVRHPFSGYSPLDIFTEALYEFRLKPFVEKAIKAAKEGRRL